VASFYEHSKEPSSSINCREFTNGVTTNFWRKKNLPQRVR